MIRRIAYHHYLIEQIRDTGSRPPHRSDTGNRETHLSTGESEKKKKVSHLLSTLPSDQDIILLTSSEKQNGETYFTKFFDILEQD